MFALFIVGSTWIVITNKMVPYQCLNLNLFVTLTKLHFVEISCHFCVTQVLILIYLEGAQMCVQCTTKLYVSVILR